MVEIGSSNESSIQKKNAVRRLIDYFKKPTATETVHSFGDTVATQPLQTSFSERELVFNPRLISIQELAHRGVRFSTVSAENLVQGLEGKLLQPLEQNSPAFQIATACEAGMSRSSDFKLLAYDYNLPIALTLHDKQKLPQRRYIPNISVGMNFGTLGKQILNGTVENNTLKPAGFEKPINTLVVFSSRPDSEGIALISEYVRKLATRNQLSTLNLEVLLVHGTAKTVGNLFNRFRHQHPTPVKV